MFLTRLLQSLAATLAVRIEIRTLAASHSTIPRSVAETHEVECRAVERAAIVPNRDIINVLPLEANLQIMVIFQQLLEPPKKHVALFFGDTVDELAVLADWIEALPSCYRIRSDDGMNRS